MKRSLYYVCHTTGGEAPDAFVWAQSPEHACTYFRDAYEYEDNVTVYTVPTKQGTSRAPVVNWENVPYVKFPAGVR